MAQFLRPDADQATGAWASTPLWSKVEEGVASDDGTLITLASGNASNFADLRLDNATDPAVSTGHILRADWDKVSGTRTLNGKLELWQGVPGTGSLVATLTTIDPTADTDYQVSLTGTEADNITDYTDLYLRVYYTYTGGGAPSDFAVDAVELEIPDAGTTHQEDGVDGVDISDTGTADLIVKPSQTDGVDISDTGAMIATFVVDGAEGIDLGDTGTMIATFVIAQTDGVDIGDSATAAVVKAVADTDGFDIGDSATEALIVKPSQTDGVDIGDSATCIKIFVIAQTDGFDIGDSAVETIIIPEAISDGIDIGDSATVAIVKAVAETDGFDIGDSATEGLRVGAVGADGVKISDAGTVVIPSGDLGSSTLRIVWG